MGRAVVLLLCLVRDVLLCRCCRRRTASRLVREVPMRSALAAGWTTASDPVTGRTYYVETSSGRTSWHRPTDDVTCSGTSAASGTGSAAVSGTSRGAALAPLWSTAIDPITGKTYYVHTNSGATRWDNPDQNC